MLSPKPDGIKNNMQFLRFCLVGAVGFIVDASILLGLTWSGVSPIQARIFSFAVAVLATWLLNRNWTFPNGKRSKWREFLGYLGVQSTGLAVNMVVYLGVLMLSEHPEKLAFFALLIASGVALSVNYLGLKWTVFQKRSKPS
jgi:putative flippase GtrA